MKREIVSDRLAPPNGVFSQATVIEAKGTMVFISGMTARTADGGIAGIGDVEVQTVQVIENLKAAVEAAGGTLEDLVRVDCYVRDIGHFPIIHKVRAKYFQNPLPASTMVEVSGFVKPEYLIEISAIAVLPGV